MRLFLLPVLFITMHVYVSAQDIFPNRGYLVNIGDAAPDIELLLTTGDKIKLNDLRGQVVVLQFTASWCSVCRKEMPHLESEIWQVHKDDDFQLIAVDYDESLESAISFQTLMKITYPMALDPGAKIFSYFAKKKSGVTRNVVIDKEGNIAFLTRLFDPEEFTAMKVKIEELLAE